MKNEWIPFEFEEESLWPEEDEEILVSDGRFVWADTFMKDEEMCYLDSSNRGFEGLAWMPLPEPYNPEKEKSNE